MRKIIILYEKNASQEYYQPFLEVAFKNPTTFFFDYVDSKWKRYNFKKFLRHGPGEMALW